MGLIVATLLFSLIPSSAGAAIDVLHQWDESREAAYVASDPTRLADLYTPDSTAAAKDLDLLATYQQRGLRVQSFEQQYFDIRVQHSDAREIRMLVTERFAGGLVLGEGRCTPIRPDYPQRHQIVLRNDGNRWRMATVTARR